MSKRLWKISRYEAMWLFALFDLPVDTQKARRYYACFRRELLDSGFIMLQFSVYARYCRSEEVAQTYRRRVHAHLPPAGQVRLIAITEAQFGKMEIYQGRISQTEENPPPQMLLF